MYFTQFMFFLPESHFPFFFLILGIKTHVILSHILINILHHTCTLVSLKSSLPLVYRLTLEHDLTPPLPLRSIRPRNNQSDCGHGTLFYDQRFEEFCCHALGIQRGGYNQSPKLFASRVI